MSEAKEIARKAIKEALETGKAVIVSGENYKTMMQEMRNPPEKWKPDNINLNNIILD